MPITSTALAPLPLASHIERAGGHSPCHAGTSPGIVDTHTTWPATSGSCCPLCRALPHAVALLPTRMTTEFRIASRRTEQDPAARAAHVLESMPSSQLSGIAPRAPPQGAIERTTFTAVATDHALLLPKAGVAVVAIDTSHARSPAGSTGARGFKIITSRHHAPLRYGYP